MEFPALSGEDIEWLQDEFVKAVFKRIEESKENRFIAKEDRGKVSRADGAARRAKLSEFILSEKWKLIPFNNFGVILRCFKFRLSVELRKGSAPDWL